MHQQFMNSIKILNKIFNKVIIIILINKIIKLAKYLKLAHQIINYKPIFNKINNLINNSNNLIVKFFNNIIHLNNNFRIQNNSINLIKLINKIFSIKTRII
jgi:hypothetical protein